MDDNKMNNDAINPSISDRKVQNFNLIIGIATLLIAIFGATFAYFTATARSNQGEVTVKSAMLSINFERGTEIKAQNLIPSTQRIALLKYQKSTEKFTPSEGESYMQDYDDYIEEGNGNHIEPYLDRKCIDANGREVCYVFWFSVMSDGQEGESTPIVGYITVEQNEFQNLSYLVYEVDYKMEDDKKVLDKYGFGVIDSEGAHGGYRLVSGSWDATANEWTFSKFQGLEAIYGDDGEVLGDVRHPKACLFGEKSSIETENLLSDDSSRCQTLSVSNGVRHDYQVVIWLNETGTEQLEQGKVFKGTVAIENSLDASSGSTLNGITGQE